MPVSEAFRRIEIFTGSGRRRRWSAGQKAAIVAESLEPGAVVCAVARRHGLTAQQLFTWRRQARRAGTMMAEDRLTFAPVVLQGTPAAPVGGVVIEVVVGDLVVRVPSDAEEAFLARVLRVARGLR